MFTYLWSLINNQRGSVQFGGGSTQKRKIQGPSAQETALNNQNAQQAALQNAYLQRLMQEQEQQMLGPLGSQHNQIEQNALRDIIARQGGSSMVSTQEANAINQVYAHQQKMAEDALLQRAQEIAGMRGMSVADSPVGNEYLRQQANVGGHFGGLRAQGMLNQGNIADQRNLALAQFQQGLRQQNAQNRLGLSQAVTPGMNLTNNMANQRIASAPVTTKKAPQYGISADNAKSGLNLAETGWKAIG